MRQVTEYHQMVHYGERGLLLYRRGEWGHNLPLTLMVDDGSKSGPKRTYNSNKGPGGGPHGGGGGGPNGDASPSGPPPPTQETKKKGSKQGSITNARQGEDGAEDPDCEKVGCKDEVNGWICFWCSGKSWSKP